MLRIIAWLSLATYLLVVGLWPPAAAPVALAFDGAEIVLAKVPALLLAAGAVWLYRRIGRPAPQTATA